MTNKSEELYNACLKVVFEIIPDFAPNFAVSDFEDAPRNAFQKQLPGIQITRCLFHYTQAVWNRQILILLNGSVLSWYYLYRRKVKFHLHFTFFLEIK